MIECKCPVCASTENAELGRVGLGIAVFHPRACLDCGVMYVDKIDVDGIKREIKFREKEGTKNNKG